MSDKRIWCLCLHSVVDKLTLTWLHAINFYAGAYGFVCGYICASSSDCVSSIVIIHPLPSPSGGKKRKKHPIKWRIVPLWSRHSRSKLNEFNTSYSLWMQWKKRERDIAGLDEALLFLVAWSWIQHFSPLRSELIMASSLKWLQLKTLAWLVCISSLGWLSELCCSKLGLKGALCFWSSQYFSIGALVCWCNVQYVTPASFTWNSCFKENRERRSSGPWELYSFSGRDTQSQPKICYGEWWIIAVNYRCIYLFCPFKVFQSLPTLPRDYSQGCHVPIM